MARQQSGFDAKLAQQQKQIETLIAGLKEQSEKIAQVSTQFAGGKPAPQLLAHNR